MIVHSTSSTQMGTHMFTFIVLFTTAASAIISSTPVASAAASLNIPTCQAMSEEHAGWNLQPYPNAYVPSGYCASIYATGLGNPRDMAVLPNGQGLLTVDPATGSIHWLNDTNSNGMIDSNSTQEHLIILQQANLDHGIVIWRARSLLLASSATNVYSWMIDLTQPNLPLSDQQPNLLVQNMPASGEITRTLVIDPTQSWLYVSVGSGSNTDNSTDRSLIKRFQLSMLPTNGRGFDYLTSGEVFATGLQNEVGMAFDKYGVLWGVQSGAPNLFREDLGGDIHTDNPAEGINKFETTGKFYGYPYCWSEYKLPTYGLGVGTQWSWPEFMTDGVHNDSWCRNLNNNVPPHSYLQPHSTPLGMTFYDTARFNLSSAPFAFPLSTSNRSYLYIPQHGSWNPAPLPESGYKIQRIEWIDTGSGVTLSPSGTEEDFFAYLSPNTPVAASAWRMEPVDVVIGDAGELYLTNDWDGNIVVIRYLQNWMNSSIIAAYNSTTNSNTTNSTWTSSGQTIYIHSIHLTYNHLSLLLLLLIIIY